MRLGRAAPLALVLLLAACAGRQEPPGEPVDGPSASDLTAADVADAVPRPEPLARYGNHSPYEVFGKTYTVMDSNRGYHERGIASWYGSKFHGRRTSSGEPYDMHLATAAHKTLPLPTYAEVTNLDNGRKVVVKINDRGPFKDDRIIDLSYGAALRLDMIGTGTARVEVRAIDTGPVPETPIRLASAGADGTWLQAGAFSQRSGAKDLERRLERAGVGPTTVDKSAGGLYRVHLGPYATAFDAERVIARMVELGFDRPHTIKR